MQTHRCSQYDLVINDLNTTYLQHQNISIKITATILFIFNTIMYLSYQHHVIQYVGHICGCQGLFDIQTMWLYSIVFQQGH